MKTAADTDTGADAATDTPSYPLPSREARRRLIVVSLAHGATHIRSAILPLVYPLLMSAMGFTYVELTAMISVTNLIGGLLQGAWGGLTRRTPAKRILGVENLGVGLALVLSGTCQSFPQLAGAVAFGQVAASPQHPVASSMITRWFDERQHATSLAVHVQVAFVFTVMTPLLGTLLLHAFGWRDTLYALALPAVAIGAWTLVALPNERVTPPVRGRGGFGREWLSLLKRPGVRRVIAAASVTAGGKGFGVLLVFIPLYLRSLHFDTAATGVLYTLFTAMSAVAPMAAGRLADRFGRARILTVLLGVSALAGVAMAAGGHLAAWMFVPLLALFGLVIYSSGPVEQALMAEATPPELRTAAYGMFFSVSAAVGAVWPVALGAVVQASGFPALFLILAASYVAGALIYGTGAKPSRTSPSPRTPRPAGS